MNITDVLDRDRLTAEVRAGTISARPHPDGGLTIYNYTPQAAYARAWTHEQRVCRGLIMADDGTIVARPFDKFFNLDELPETMIAALPAGPCVAHEKMDGSLGIVYWHRGLPWVATRGSFVSSQAQWATAWLRQRVDMADLRQLTEMAGTTLLVEIISPVSRIVVNYDYEGLVIIGARKVASGTYADPEMLRIMGRMLGLRVAAMRHVDDLATFADQVDTTTKDEGWVIAWPGGLRVKLKTSEYLALHRLMMSCTVKYIRELLERQGVDALRAYLPALPAHLALEVKRVAQTLLERREAVLSDAWTAYQGFRAHMRAFLPHAMDDRKSFAGLVNTPPRADRSILFFLWDVEFGLTREGTDPLANLNRLVWKRVSHADLTLFGDVNEPEEMGA